MIKCKRCNFCNKKLKLIEIKCLYCKNSYCLVHKYPDIHKCKNESKIIENNKKKIMEENPVITHLVVEKI